MSPFLPPKDVPSNEKTACQREALRHIERMFELGFRDFEMLEGMSNLAPIRALPAYRKLIETWKKR